jgi:hypothetical protein
MLIESRDGSVDPDYFQFYLKTRGGEHAADQVSGEAYEVQLEAPSPGFVYVGTLKKYSTTRLRIEVHDSEPGPIDEWQHIAEVSLTGDGLIEVLSWPGEPALTVPTPVGPLRLRVMWAGLEPGLDEGLRSDGPSKEHLALQLWPAPLAERRVLRWWSGWKLPPPSAAAPDGRRQIEGQDDIVQFLRAGLRAVPVSFGMTPGVPAPPLPGGPSGHCAGIWGDPRDGTWWVDGYAVRRILRPATEDEVRNLLRQAQLQPPELHDRRPDPRWTAMLLRIGLAEPPP